MENLQLKGTGVALLTPFNEDRSIDFEALKKLINYQIDDVDFFLLLGSTSESATLSYDEQWAVVEFALAHINKKVPVIVAATSNDTQSLVDKIQNFNFENIDALLSAAPFYNKPSQEGIYQHFSAIANASPVPLILYNIPGRTASNINAETALRLACDFKNIAGIKDSSANVEQAARILEERPSGFKFFSGEDPLTVPLISLGADGAISVSANAYPKAFSHKVNSALEGNFQSAREGYFNLLKMMRLLFAEGNPAGVKANLAARGLIKNVLRLPLTPVSDALYNQIESLIKEE